MPSRPCDLRATSSSGPDRPLQSSPTSMIAQVSALMTRTRTAIAVAASSGLPPPPLQTTRLGIKVGGPDSYEVGVAALAKATGQRPASPPAAVKRYESESSLESGMGTEGGSEMKGRKVRKTRICIRELTGVHLSTLACIRRRKRSLSRSTMTCRTRSLTTRNSRSTNARLSRRRSNRDLRRDWWKAQNGGVHEKRKA